MHRRKREKGMLYEELYMYIQHAFCTLFRSLLQIFRSLVQLFGSATQSYDL